jgi:hypothetical protein
MQKYIDQLIEDIQAAHKPEEENKNGDPPSLKDHFREIEKFIGMEEPEHDFSYYCGLREQQFPAAELLTSKQIRLLFNAFSKLVLSYNISVLIPKAIPLPEAYSLLISVLNRKVFIVNFGNVVVEFCTTDPPSCPFKEHCLCKKNTDKKEEDEFVDDKKALN